MKRFILYVSLIFIPLMALSQTPLLTHVFDIRATIDAPVYGDSTSLGRIVTIPITGGSVTGQVTGTILPGGADHQIVDSARRRTLLKAQYSVLTPDSTVIEVINEGINCDSDSGYYFMAAPRFRCDPSSPYGWLNDRIFVCRPVAFEPGAITLRVWQVQ